MIDHPCDGCEYFERLPEMGAHLPYCGQKREYDPQRCGKFEPNSLYQMYFDMSKRAEKGQRLV